jgi:TonB family protein
MKKPATIVIACISVFIMTVSSQSPQMATLRMGPDVREAAIIHQVLPIYPEGLQRLGTSTEVNVEVLIDKSGEVTSAKVLSGDPAFYNEVDTCVKSWRFSASRVAGNPIPVIAELVFLFNAKRTPYPLNWGRTGITAAAYVGPPTVRLIMDRQGNLRKPGEPAIPLEELRDFQVKNGNALLCIGHEHGVTFSVVERTLKTLRSMGLRNVMLESPVFRSARSVFFLCCDVMPDWSLFYSSLYVNNGSHLITLVGTEPTLVPPKFSLDSVRLTQLANESGPAAGKGGGVLFYTIFVNEAGKILGVETWNDQKDEISAVLEKVGVTAPGFCKGVPVPVASLVAIPYK